MRPGTVTPAADDPALCPSRAYLLDRCFPYMALVARIGAVIAASITVLLSFALVVRDGLSGLLFAPLDFTAFRCGGLLLSRGADPYRVEPLRSCELLSLYHVGKQLTPHLVVPAPLPPYALLAFAGLAHFWPPVPSQIWAWLLLASFVATCLLLRPALRTPFGYVVIPFMTADFLASLIVGQVVPLELALIALTIALVRSGHPRLGAIAAAATLFEPNIGLPVCLALAAYVPRARGTLALGLLSVGALSLYPGGPLLDAEYFTHVLPDEAFTEGLDASKQYGLSAQLALAGVPASFAVATGAISYALMTALGMRLGKRLADRFHEPAFLLATPSAFALIGGTYVHIHQIAVALPLALLLVGRVERYRVLLATSIVLLATPVQTIGELALYQPIPQARLLAAEHQMDLVDDSDMPAAGVWAQWVAAGGHTTHGEDISLAEKIPTWLGLFALAFIAFEAAGARRGKASVPRRQGAPLDATA